MTARAEVIRRYLDYLDACTRHAWNELPQLLAETMLVNGQSRTQAEMSKVKHYSAQATDLASKTAPKV